AITDYTVEFSSNGGSSWTAFAHTASTTASRTVTGLTNGTTYTFRVSAVNVAGTGASSSTITKTPGLPDAPTSLAVTLVQQTATTTNANLTWTAPGNTGGVALSDYTIQYSTDGG